jgi:predicted regulator of Ras-like GTPase activity (Roadblock/LC7/MglB family)
MADRNGLPIVAALRAQFDLATVSAMTTLAFRAAQDVFQNFRYRDARFVLMEGEDAVLVVIAIRGGFSALALLRSGGEFWARPSEFP